MKTSQFKVESWQEEWVVEGQLAHAQATYSIEGDLKGSIQVDYSMYYFDYNKADVHQSTSRFEGFGIFTGEIDGQKGSFSYYDRGLYLESSFDTSIEIIAGSGTGDFKTIEGSGSYYPVGSNMEMTINLKMGD